MNLRLILDFMWCSKDRKCYLHNATENKRLIHQGNIIVVSSNKWINSCASRKDQFTFLNIYSESLNDSASNGVVSNLNFEVKTGFWGNYRLKIRLKNLIEANKLDFMNLRLILDFIWCSKGRKCYLHNAIKNKRLIHHGNGYVRNF